MLKKILFSLFCLSLFTSYINAQDIVINEFMASNDSLTLIVDDFGEADDWVELYNRSSSSIDLGGYYFSDDYLEPEKWSFPDGISIPANGYLIVWTDKDDEQGDLHTNFKLKKDGEQLILSTSNFTVLDSITFGEQETNISMSRIPNGTGPFIQQAATFNSNNGDEVATTVPEIFEEILLFPNPATSYTQLQLQFKDRPQTLEITLYNTLGKRVYYQQLDTPSQKEYIQLSTSGLTAGLYFVELNADNNRVAYPLSVND